MMFINLNEIAILNNCGIDYDWTTNGVNKSDAINVLQNANLTKKKKSYIKIKKNIKTYKMGKKVTTSVTLKLKTTNFTNTKAQSWCRQK